MNREERMYNRNLTHVCTLENNKQKHDILYKHKCHVSGEDTSCIDCKHLKSIENAKIAEWLKLNQVRPILEAIAERDKMEYRIRPDFAVDRDERIVPYDVWLRSSGFKYVHTNPGEYGGSRQYTHSSNLFVGVGKQQNNITWYIDRLSDHKEIVNGTGLQSLISNVTKLIGSTSIKNYSRFSTMKKAFGIIVPKRLDELK